MQPLYISRLREGDPENRHFPEARILNGNWIAQIKMVEAALDNLRNLIKDHIEVAFNTSSDLYRLDEVFTLFGWKNKKYADRYALYGDRSITGVKDLAGQLRDALQDPKDNAEITLVWTFVDYKEALDFVQQQRFPEASMGNLELALENHKQEASMVIGWILALNECKDAMPFHEIKQWLKKDSMSRVLFPITKELRSDDYPEQLIPMHNLLLALREYVKAQNVTGSVF